VTISKSIVIEGPNGSGKSYLAKQLSEKYGLPIMHSIKPDNSFIAIDESYRQYYAAKSPKIFDRSHAISRLVYQRDILGILEAELLEVMAKHLSFTTNLIFCTGSGKRDINKPHYNEKLIKETEDQVPIINSYTSVMSWLKYQEYNFEKNNISSLQLT